ncbi:MAG TPA: type II secretion system F family protein [Candidatus Tumulicola sp.]|jgi:tight adherence protein C
MGWLFYFIPFLFGASAFLFALSLIPSKSALTAQLDALKTRDVAERDTAQFASFAKVFTPERRALLSRQLAEAGWYTVTPAQMGLRVVAGAFLGIMLALLLWAFAPIATWMLVSLMILVAVIGTYFPILMLNQAMEARKTDIQKSLPEFLDMLSSTVQAGLALNAAMAYAVDAAPGALGEEINEVLSEVRLGRNRAEALKAAAERTNQQEFKTAVLAISQSERLGSNIAKVLADLAEDTRHHRIMLVEEAAAKLPVKMVFPMAFFMLPAIFVVIFGPIIASYFSPK